MQGTVSPTPMGPSTKTKNINSLKAFAKELFRLWDSKEYGKIKLKYLIQHFISLGLAANKGVAMQIF